MQAGHILPLQTISVQSYYHVQRDKGFCPAHCSLQYDHSKNNLTLWEICLFDRPLTVAVITSHLSVQ